MKKKKIFIKKIIKIMIPMNQKLLIKKVIF